MEIREKLRSELLKAGAVKVGFTRAEKPSQEALNTLYDWLARKHNAGMEYMERNSQLREDLSLLLPGVKTIISLAFPYAPHQRRSESLPRISVYAANEDYHKVVRRRLKPVCRQIEAQLGCASRICVDSAPVLERYWAMRAGLGRLGWNRCLIAHGYGSYIFLAEILLTAEIPADAPSTESCLQCGACLRSCPTGALSPQGIDASLCLSYLTIEHKGELQAESEAALNTPQAGNTLYGCDICQEVCPHNLHITTSTIEEFAPTPLYLELTPQQILEMDSESFADIFSKSPIKRAGLEKLQQSARRVADNRRE